jgi:hypothetical protein
MFPTSTPSTSSKRENYPTSTPLNQVYSHEQLINNTVNINSPNAFQNTVNNPLPPTTTTRTYKTREKLYYETDYVKGPNSPINVKENATNSILFEPFVRKQQGGTTVEEVSHEELPPIASLHDNLLPTSNISNSTNVNTFSNLCTGSPMVINGIIGSPMKSSAIPNMESSQFAPTQWSSVFVNGGQQQTTRAITVFGFPPNCRNEILLSFQLHGSIESFDGSDSGSNWINIIYESEWSAQKALNRNGSIFQSTGSMIGVIPMQTAVEKVNNSADSFMSPIKRSTKNMMPDTTNNTSIFLKKEKKTNEIDLKSLPNESSLVTKAVNYIFGW